MLSELVLPVKWSKCGMGGYLTPSGLPPETALDRAVLIAGFLGNQTGFVIVTEPGLAALLGNVKPSGFRECRSRNHKTNKLQAFG